MPNAPAIRTLINGRWVARDEVLAWEAARLPKAARKIGLPVPGGSPARRRAAFAESKLALGADEIRRRLHRDTRLADTIARTATRLSRGHRATSVCDLHVTGGSAEDFVRWFADTDRADYTRGMIAANPDHFLIDTAEGGRQEVVETTGGSPLATRFFVDYDDTASLVTPRDPAFPLDLSGAARDGRGHLMGGVRHEFRDEPDGFHARLRVEFPAFTAPHMINRHRWHLACEFGNWIEFAFTGNQ
ncbi:hypothetical protein [Saccharothrix australiensis]|uniref:Uncharacterized protein n=1 Tax=Saccharothrix australiensis TaxID=2072 RepID=A0A495W717_9PSEU|nr:hypothetical protein [Saccharothrix australiensis]RKT55598.1 hypothetical protein C8E97_4277 [Saccharothrix australiensis]